MNGSQRCELHNLAYFRWVGWELFSVQSLAVAILVKSYSAQNFQRKNWNQVCCSLMACHDVRRLFRCGRFRRVERGSGTAAASGDHLEPTPAEIQVRTCQACDAGSRSQNGGGQWGSSLDIYSPTLVSSFSSLQCAECVDYEPVFGGALQRPCIRHT